MSPNEIIINQIAQDKLSIDEGVEWFNELNEMNQTEVISLVHFYVKQSYPNKELLELAISQIPTTSRIQLNFLKKTYLKIPESLFSKPEKLFISLITIFKISDTYRRDKWCKNGCKHKWHNL